MPNHKALFVASLAVISTATFGGQWYRSADPVGRYCATPDLATEIRHADAERVARLEGNDFSGPSCMDLRPNQPVELRSGEPSDDSPKEVSVPGNQLRYPTTYIAGPLVPASPPNQAVATCKLTDVGPNGEVDRWMLEKDGTPKLKRFMITSRCVNGQMRSFTKRLN